MAKSRYLAAALFATLAVSCAKKGAEKESLTPASEDGDQEAQECQSNLDCGKGYVCAFDHARSHVVRYCMQE